MTPPAADPRGPALGLRRKAEAEAQALPPVLLAAQALARTVQMGHHGRRRAGVGEEFWQYRPVHQGDEARFIDWRRSGRSDTQYIRQREMQQAQTLYLWVDSGASMQFSGMVEGRKARPMKSERAQVLALALAALAVRAGERVGLTGAQASPRPGKGQLMTLAQILSAAAAQSDYDLPDTASVRAQSKVVLLSDFLADPQDIERRIGHLSGRGVTGVMMQVLDPVEEGFPFDGRTVFESMAGAVRFETRSAGDLRARYHDRLAGRRAHLARIAQAAGWQFSTHHTGEAAQAALLWLHNALERGR